MGRERAGIEEGKGKETSEEENKADGEGKMEENNKREGEGEE